MKKSIIIILLSLVALFVLVGSKCADGKKSETENNKNLKIEEEGDYEDNQDDSYEDEEEEYEDNEDEFKDNDDIELDSLGLETDTLDIEFE